MGNYRFRLSNMIPNAWFYKLKEFTTSSTTKNHRKIHPNKKSPSAAAAQCQKQKQQQQHQHQPKQTSPAEEPQPRTNRPRKSYHYTRKFTCQRDPAAAETPASTPLYDPPRKSPTKRKSTAGSCSSFRSPNPISAPCRHGTIFSPTAVLHSHLPSPPADTSQMGLFHDPLFCPHNRPTPLPSEDSVPMIIVESPQNKSDPIISGISTLGPIIAKPEKFKELSTRGSAVRTGNKEQRGRSLPMRRLSVSSPGSGVRLRVNSPRIMNYRSSSSRSRSSRSFSKSTSESIAIVKSSFDPQRDFKESMVEMIEENNIKGSKALEDLLACYLSLNSDEYHDVIIKVFKQIWFDLHGPVGD